MPKTLSNNTSQSPATRSKRTKKTVDYKEETNVETKSTKTEFIDKNKDDSFSEDMKTFEDLNTLINPKAKRARNNLVKSEHITDDANKCVICEEQLNMDSGHSDARFHYATHLYEEGKMSQMVTQIAGKMKYNCPHMEQGCTKRLMNHREVCMHLATQHQKLKDLLSSDPRPSLASVVATFYPPVLETKILFKKEPEVASNFEDACEEDIDDPKPSPVKVKTPSSIKRGPASKRGTPSTLPKKVMPPNAGRSSSAVLKQEGNGVDKVHSCLLCDKKDGRNLNLGSGLSDLKYHYTVCYYGENSNRYLASVDPGKENLNSEGRIVDEFGVSFKYRCPFIDCKENTGKKKDMGYKEYCIHIGVKHHLLEKFMSEDLSKRPKLAEVVFALSEERVADGEDLLDDIPPVVVEEIHVCLICEGKDRVSGRVDKEAKNLSFNEKTLWKTRYHYSSCIYDSGVYWSKYPAGKENSDEAGKPKDFLGVSMKYSCREKRCDVKRKMGYKEFTIHMANDHGGLDEVLQENEREDLRNLGMRIRKK